MTELNCAGARSLVSDYIDGELDATTARALEHHLESCGSCPPLYASLITTLAELKALDVPPAGVDELALRVIAAVEAMGMPERHEPPDSQPSSAAAR